MVISEAMAWRLPILSTNIAGIPEMLTDGLEGFLFAPGDSKKAISGMKEIVNDHELRRLMGLAGAVRFSSVFDLEIMVESYRDLMLKVAPPVLLLDILYRLVPQLTRLDYFFLRYGPYTGTSGVHMGV